MTTIFWDVDTQVDFIEPEGNLAVEGAVEIKDNLGKLLRSARQKNIPILGSVDYHEPEDEEITEEPDFEETFPAHCLAGEKGQEKIKETAPEDPLWIHSAPLEKNVLEQKIRNHEGEIYFRKQKFDVFSNPNVQPALEIINPARIVIFGVTLDVCVRFASEGFYEQGYNVTVVEDATKALNPAKGKELLENWKNRGIDTATTEEIIN
ncbi:MAG: cysteine hydrolase family protein [bacterium]